MGLGGIFVAAFGREGGFIIDSMTYLISAAFLFYGVKGNYDVTRTSSSTMANTNSNSNTTTTTNIDEDHSIDCEERNLVYGQHESINNNNNNESSPGTMQMFMEACRFAFRDKPILGAYMLFKGSAGLSFGAADILNVSFSEIGSEDDESLTSLKLGLLFGSVGIGCIIASVVSDQFTNL